MLNSMGQPILKGCVIKFKTKIKSVQIGSIHVGLYGFGLD